MKDIEILTWNVNWFRGKKSSAKSDDYNLSDCKEDALKGFISEINKFFASKPTVAQIVFAQEVPYQYKEKYPDQNGKKYVLNSHPYWRQLKEAFPDDKYKIIFNEGENDLRKNIAIFKVNSGFSEASVAGITSPRLIPVKTDYAMFIGVHMPIVDCLSNMDDKVWGQVIEYTRIFGIKIIILCIDLIHTQYFRKVFSYYVTMIIKYSYHRT